MNALTLKYLEKIKYYFNLTKYSSQCQFRTIAFLDTFGKEVGTILLSIAYIGY